MVQRTTTTKRRIVEDAPRTRRRVEDAPVKRRRSVEDEPAPKRTARMSKTAGRGATKRRAPKPNRYAEVKPVRDMFTRTSLLEYLAERADVDKKTAKAVVDALTNAMVASLRPRGPGKFVIPGVMRLVTINKKAVKGGKTVNNPFKPGETMVTKDKPARTFVKARLVKDFKECANR